MASPVGTSFLDHFAALRDPRQGWKVVFPLSDDEAPRLEAPAEIATSRRSYPGDLRRERTRDLDCIRDPIRHIERSLGRRADTNRSERMAAGGVAAW